MSQMPHKNGLHGRSFWALIATQFLGAFNDNAYKMIVMLVVSHDIIASEGGAFYLAGSTAVFAIAYILFSSTAGWLADRFSKRTIIIWAKVAEIAVMLLAFFVLLLSSSATGPFALQAEKILLIAVLFLMAAQSAFFSPSKYGILPELLDTEELSSGNGIITMTTYFAIILGTGMGGWLVYLGGYDKIYYAGLIVIAIAVLGTITSFFIAPVPASGAQRKFPRNFLTDSAAGIDEVMKDRPLFLAILADVYLWVFGAVYIQNFIPYAREIIKIENERVISTLGAVWCIGIGLGSLLAGRMSERKIELGMVPFGAIGMTIGSFMFLFTGMAESYEARLWLTAVNIAFIGLFAGFYFVPLNAYIQRRAPEQSRGGTIAVLNFITFWGVLAGALIVLLLSMGFKLNPSHIFVAIGFITAGVTIYICTKLPDFFIRFVMWLATHTIYRFRVVGSENVPASGPALLVCNHVSLVDAGLITACLPRFVRFLMYREYYDHPLLNWAAKPMRAIPISYKDGPRAIATALAEARKALVENGELVCIFAEGSITRTGNLRAFRPGLEKIVRGTNVPIIPVHLDRVWGSVFSFEGGRVLWKFPKALPYPVTVSFGKPMPPTSTAYELRTAVAELGAEAFEYRRGAQVLLHHAFIRTAKVNWARQAVADSTGARFRYGGLLVASILLGRRIRRLTRKQRYVGIMLPASVGGVVANIAALFARRVPVNLNFTASRDTLNSAINQCGLKVIITSRRFVDRAKLELRPEMVMIEDLAALVGTWSKIKTTLLAFCLPAWVLRRMLSKRRLKPDDVATVIFTSGTTGEPKGVVLSHKNIASNIVGFCQVMSFTSNDCMMGVLPFFHSFGFTTTIWAPLLRDFRVVYHSNPLDAQVISRMIDEQKVTHFVATPTLLRTYIRKWKAEDLETLRVVMVGAEKMKEDIADAFERKFDIRPLEGYGCTELSPVAAVNIPDVPAGEGMQLGTKRGTIGQPLPNIAARIVHPETGQPLPPGEEGMLLIKGPSVMLRYLDRPDDTERVIADGWYRTGDLATIDEDGFITIIDRLSRFSKIGGEMVPHAAVEDAIVKILGVDATTNPCVVTSVDDPEKGERLAVICAQLPVPLDELWRRLKDESGLPPLWLPKRDMFFIVDAIPVLATGKVAIKEAQKIAQAKSENQD